SPGIRESSEGADVIRAPPFCEGVNPAIIGLTLVLEGKRSVGIDSAVEGRRPAPQVHSPGHAPDRYHVNAPLGIYAVTRLHPLDDEGEDTQTCRHRRQLRQA